MNIRHFQPGDENAQLAIYNTAGASLPKFKPATLFEIQRRTQAKDFDPAMRWFAEDQGKPIAYTVFQPNGRISYPWCLPGHEQAAEPLFAHALAQMKQRGMRKALCAYRGDWPAINDFFQKHGFLHARDMTNFLLAFENMPTPSARIPTNITPATSDDFAAILALNPAVFRVGTAAELREALWNNPYIDPAESVFVMRSRGGAPIAAGVFIRNPTYADPRALDSAMPCFRLGAFGTEGMTAKRVRGLFSFVASPDRNLFAIGMDMMGYAACRLSEDDDIAVFAAQVASDVPSLLAFYQRTFERQGSFPMYERDLANV